MLALAQWRVVLVIFVRGPTGVGKSFVARSGRAGLSRSLFQAHHFSSLRRMIDRRSNACGQSHLRL